MIRCEVPCANLPVSGRQATTGEAHDQVEGDVARVSALAMLASVAEAKADPPFITPGMFSFTVPTTGEYALDVLGASGGASINAVGGLGAEVSGDIVLTAGETLTLFVGGQGQNAGLFFGGGRRRRRLRLSPNQCPCCRWRRRRGGL